MSVIKLKTRDLKTKAKIKKANSIAKKYNKNALKIIELLNENVNYEHTLVFGGKIISESINTGTKKNPKNVNVKLLKWFEIFEDEDTSKPIEIERNCIIEVEGKKSNGWQELRYYSEKDVKLLELQPIK